MNVPAHLIFGVAAFGNRGNAAITTAAVLGSFAPDVSLFVMAGWSLYIAGISPQVVFDQYYFSDLWQSVFAFDNSFVFWGLALAAAIWARRPVWIAFILAGLMHLSFDFLLHNADARMQFWPLSDWKFFSPISYWDRRYYASIVGPIELAITLILAVLLWRRYRKRFSRVLILLAALSEIIVSGIFGIVVAH